MAERQQQQQDAAAAAQQAENEKAEKKAQAFLQEVGKFLRKNLPPKQTTLFQQKVDYFIGNKALDLLMTTPWATTPEDKKIEGEIYIVNRAHGVQILNVMLQTRYFYRVKANFVKREVKDKPEGAGSEAEKSGAEKSPEASKQKKKEKKKVKFTVHDVQEFVDDNEPYVWIFDFVPLRTWIMGGLLVLAAIGACLFPLWPSIVRQYVYYLSIAAASFLGVIFGLAAFKHVLFAFIWLVTLGRHHFWLLPNLTEDVGFFESFWPLYYYEYRGGDKPAVEKKKKKPKKAKYSDDEAEPLIQKDNGDQFELVDQEEVAPQ